MDAALHGLIYQQALPANCILHTFSSYAAVLLAQHKNKETLTLCADEILSQERSIDLPLFDNETDILVLIEKIKAKWQTVHQAQALMVRGVGLYSWGTTVFEAKRYTECLAFLLECEYLHKLVK